MKRFFTSHLEDENLKDETLKADGIE